MAGLRTLVYSLMICIVGSFACDDEPGILSDLLTTKIEKLKAETHLRLPNRSNLSSNELTLIYTWDISDNNADFDGFLYKFHERDTEGAESFGGGSFFPSFYGFQDYDAVTCEDVENATIWVNDKGNLVQCKLPCSEHLPTPCGSSSKLCTYLSDGFKPLSKDTRSIKIPIEFAKVYDLVLAVYKGWDVGHEVEYDTMDQMAFCREELITNLDVDLVNADRFCKRRQVLKVISPTGPATDLEEHQTGFNATSKRGFIIFRWKAPYDIHVNAILTKFYVNTDGFIQESVVTLEKPYAPQDRIFYSVKIGELEVDVEYFIKITPRVKWNTDCYLGCTYYGHSLERKFVYREPTRKPVVVRKIANSGISIASKLVHNENTGEKKIVDYSAVVIGTVVGLAVGISIVVTLLIMRRMKYLGSEDLITTSDTSNSPSAA